MAGSKGRMNHYEGMFLVSQASAADLGACVDHIREGIERAKGEIIAFRKWDERRLAYEIQKHKRGVYFLTYFTADPAFLVDVERYMNLSETVLRFMVTKPEHLTEDQMRAQDEMGRLIDEARLRGEEEPAGAGAASAEAAAEVPAEPAAAGAEAPSEG